MGPDLRIMGHRLVWEVLRGPIPRGLQINHKNGIKYDNRPENLEVVTQLENRRHAARTGLQVVNGENSHFAKLSNRETEELRQEYRNGSYLLREMAGKYGISISQVSRIVRGKSRIEAIHD